MDFKDENKEYQLDKKEDEDEDMMNESDHEKSEVD